MKKAIVWAIVLGVILNFASYGYCQDAFRKLGRGVANVALSPVELPKNVADAYYKHHTLSESVIFGIPKGIADMVIRCAAGVYDIVTFPFPIPEDYRPVLMPEYIWENSY